MVDKQSDTVPVLLNVPRIVHTFYKAAAANGHVGMRDTMVGVLKQAICDKDYFIHPTTPRDLNNAR
jgi:hypothetical protein